MDFDFFKNFNLNPKIVCIIFFIICISTINIFHNSTWKLLHVMFIFIQCFGKNVSAIFENITRQKWHEAWCRKHQGRSWKIEYFLTFSCSKTKKWLDKSCSSNVRLKMWSDWSIRQYPWWWEGWAAALLTVSQLETVLFWRLNGAGRAVLN